MAKEKKSEAITSEKFRVQGRGSFLRLDKPRPYEEGAVPRWEATTMLDPADTKGLESIKLILKVSADIAKQKWGVVPRAIKVLASQFIPGQAAPGADVKDDKIELAFYSGTDKAETNPESYESYKGLFIVPAHEYEDRAKPAIASRKGVSVSPGDDQWPYSGCYILTSLTAWTYEGRGKRRIGLNLRGVQFVKDGEPFGGGGEHSAEEEFDALEDDEAAAAGGMDWDD